MSALPRRWAARLRAESASSRCRGQARSMLLVREVNGAIGIGDGGPTKLAVVEIGVLMLALNQIG